MVATEIRGMIRDAGFQPGDKIFSEHDLTKRLQVSRASVREAIRILEVTGLVSVHQGKGVFLREPREEGFDALGRYIREHSDSLFEIFEVRLLVEPACAGRAAVAATDREIQEMRESLQRFESHCAADELEGAIQQDEVFHTKIAEASRNRTLHVLMKTFARNLSEGWITSLTVPGRQIKTISEHRAILDGIEARDADAASTAMHLHLTNALREIRGYANSGTDGE
jgi:GntR family transcriptional repressor for pyruvate dehydrogenase complex